MAKKDTVAMRNTRAAVATNGSIFLRAPDSLTHLSDIDPKKIGKTLVAQKPLRDILRKREEEGVYGWTLCTLPTDELAKQAKDALKRLIEQEHGCVISLSSGAGKHDHLHLAAAYLLHVASERGQ